MAEYSTACPDTTFGATCSLSCYTSKGYGLSNNPVVAYTCESNGHWYSPTGNISCPSNPNAFTEDISEPGSGCPPNIVTGTIMMSKQLFISSTTIWWAAATSIRLFNGRADLALDIDGASVAECLPYTASQQWLSGQVYGAGTFQTGDSPVISTVPLATNAWGCTGDTFSKIFLMLIPNTQVIRLSLVRKRIRILCVKHIGYVKYTPRLACAFIVQNSANSLRWQAHLLSLYVSWYGYTPKKIQVSYFFLFPPSFFIIPPLFPHPKTQDNRGGCPGTQAASTTLVSNTFTIYNPNSVIFVRGEIRD